MKYQYELRELCSSSLNIANRKKKLKKLRNEIQEKLHDYEDLLRSELNDISLYLKHNTTLTSTNLNLTTKMYEVGRVLISNPVSEKYRRELREINNALVKLQDEEKEKED